MKTYKHFCTNVKSTSMDVLNKSCKENKTHVLCSVHFFRSLMALWIIKQISHYAYIFWLYVLNRCHGLPLFKQNLKYPHFFSLLFVHIIILIRKDNQKHIICVSTFIVLRNYFPLLKTVQKHLGLLTSGVHMLHWPISPFFFFSILTYLVSCVNNDIL
jgi:hypothetical protein